MTTPLIPTKRQIKQAQLHRQAVIQFARMAAKRAVQAEMRAQGIRLTLVFPATITAKAIEYLSAHRELFDEARERAKRMGYVDPLANISTNAQQPEACSDTTISVQISGAK